VSTPAASRDEARVDAFRTHVEPQIEVLLRVSMTLIGSGPMRKTSCRWEGPFLSDERRVLYRRLVLVRASLLRTYSAGTLLRYARTAAGGRRLSRPVEDTRQLGGDAVVLDGVVRVLWQPRTPDDRVRPELVRATVERLTAGG